MCALEVKLHPGDGERFQKAYKSRNYVHLFGPAIRLPGQDEQLFVQLWMRPFPVTRRDTPSFPAVIDIRSLHKVSLGSVWANGIALDPNQFTDEQTSLTNINGDLFDLPDLHSTRGIRVNTLSELREKETSDPLLESLFSDFYQSKHITLPYSHEHFDEIVIPCFEVFRFYFSYITPVVKAMTQEGGLNRHILNEKESKLDDEIPLLRIRKSIAMASVKFISRFVLEDIARWELKQFLPRLIAQGLSANSMNADVRFPFDGFTDLSVLGRVKKSSRKLWVKRILSCNHPYPDPSSYKVELDIPTRPQHKEEKTNKPPPRVTVNEETNVLSTVIDGVKKAEPLYDPLVERINLEELHTGLRGEKPEITIRKMEPSKNARGREVSADQVDGFTTNENGGEKDKEKLRIVNTRTQVGNDKDRFRSPALSDFEKVVQGLAGQKLSKELNTGEIRFMNLGQPFITSISPHAIAFPIDSNSVEDIETLYSWAFFGEAKYNEKTNKIALNLRHLVMVEIVFNYGVFYIIEFQEEPENICSSDTKRPPSLIFMSKNYEPLSQNDIVEGLNEYAKNRHTWGGGDAMNRAFRRRINRNGDHDIIDKRKKQIRERISKFLGEKITI